MTDDLGTPHLRFERRGPLGWCIIDRPDAREDFKRIVNGGYGLVDEISFARSAPSGRDAAT